MDSSIRAFNFLNRLIFMQDNVSSHKTKDVLSVLQKEQTPLLKNWPMQIPDINSIENLSDYIDRNVLKYKIQKVENLWNKIRMIWNSITAEFLSILVQLVHRRINDVIKNKGKWKHVSFMKYFAE